jgi:hypothetical protein
MTTHNEKPRKAKNKKGNQTMNKQKNHLMTAIFLTVALVSSAVEAGVIRINGTIAGSESDAPFPDPAEGFYVNGSVTSTDTAAWSIHTVLFGSHWTSLSWVRHLGKRGEVV